MNALEVGKYFTTKSRTYLAAWPDHDSRRRKRPRKSSLKNDSQALGCAIKHVGCDLCRDRLGAPPACIFHMELRVYKGDPVLVFRTSSDYILTEND